MTVVPDLAEPVAGWRSWRVDYGLDGPQLASPLRPQTWARRAATSATCVAGCAPCPSSGCRCGLYAMAGPGRLPLDGRGPVVLGCVALWGRVVEHDAGWRGEHGYPLVLIVLSSWPPGFLARLRRLSWFAAHDDRREYPGGREDEDLDPVGALARELARLYSVPVHAAAALPDPDGFYAAPPNGPIADAVRAEAVTGLARRREGDPEALARLDDRVQDLIGSTGA